MQDGEKLEVTNRELIEFIETSKSVLELAKKHDLVLYGNGSVGLLRKMDEFMGLAKNLLDLAEKHEKTLYGNGGVGLVRQNDDLKRTVRMLVTVLVALVTPLIGITISFVVGLLINRVEVVIH